MSEERVRGEGFMSGWRRALPFFGVSALAHLLLLAFLPAFAPSGVAELGDRLQEGRSKTLLWLIEVEASSGQAVEVAGASVTADPMTPPSPSPGVPTTTTSTGTPDRRPVEPPPPVRDEPLTAQSVERRSAPQAGLPSPLPAELPAPSPAKLSTIRVPVDVPRSGLVTPPEVLPAPSRSWESSPSAIGSAIDRAGIVVERKVSSPGAQHFEPAASVASDLGGVIPQLPPESALPSEPALPSDPAAPPELTPQREDALLPEPTLPPELAPQSEAALLPEPAQSFSTDLSSAVLSPAAEELSGPPSPGLEGVEPPKAAPEAVASRVSSEAVENPSTVPGSTPPELSAPEASGFAAAAQASDVASSVVSEPAELASPRPRSTGSPASTTAEVTKGEESVESAAEPVEPHDPLNLKGSSDAVLDAGPLIPDPAPVSNENATAELDPLLFDALENFTAVDGERPHGADERSNVLPREAGGLQESLETSLPSGMDFPSGTSLPSARGPLPFEGMEPSTDAPGRINAAGGRDGQGKASGESEEPHQIPETAEVEVIEGSIFVPPRVKSKVAPSYPSRARRQGAEGSVILEVDVDEKGRSTGAKLLQSSGRKDLDAAALEAVRKWQFYPAQEDERPVSGRVEITVMFQLN